MNIKLTQAQEKEIAINWIKQQQLQNDGYKKVLDTLLMGAHFAVWPWDDALKYAVKKCARTYFVEKKTILRWLENKEDEAT